MNDILITTSSREIKFWNSKTGKYLFQILDAHDDQITDLRFFPPKYLITTSRDCTVRVFDLETKRLCQTYRKFHYNHISSIVMHKKDSFITCGNDRKIILWTYNKKNKLDSTQDMFLTKELLRKFEFRDTSNAFSCMCTWSDNIIAIGKHSSIGLFDITLGRFTSNLIIADSYYNVCGYIRRIKMAPNGLVYASSEGGRLYVFNPKAKAKKKTKNNRNRYNAPLYNYGTYGTRKNDLYYKCLVISIEVNKLKKKVTALDVNEIYAITGDQNGIVKVWDHRNKHVCVDTIKAHAFNVTDICFIDKNSFCTSSWDTTIKIFDLDGGKQKCVIEGHKYGAGKIYSLKDVGGIINQKDVFLERIEFMEENEFFDFEIKLKNKNLLLFKALLSDSEIIQKLSLQKVNIEKEKNMTNEDSGEVDSDSDSDSNSDSDDEKEIEHIVIDKKLDIDESILQKVLFGYWSEIKSTSFVDYYILFLELQMKKHMLVLLNEMKYIDVDLLLELLPKVVKRFKEMDDSNFNNSREYVSSFTANLFNILKKHSQKYGTYKVENDMKKINMIKRFKKHTFSPLHRHKDFGKKLEIKKFTFEYLFQENLKNLFKSKGYTNCIVETRDGKLIKANLEILIMRNSFFFSLYNFPGSEFEALKSDKVVKVDILSYEGVISLLEFIYLGSVETFKMNGTVILDVIEFSEMFFDYNLKMHLIYSFVKCIQTESEGNVKTLYNRIMKFPKKLQTEIMRVLSFEQEKKVFVKNMKSKFKK